MKGVYGDVQERIFEMQKSYLQPESTYHHDSGGTPSHILDLSYEDFLAFHRKHYHPTNATFFTFGDIPASEHQSRFEELALSRFEGKGEKVEATDEKRYIAPLSVQTAYPHTGESEQFTHILVSWLLTPAYDAFSYYEAELISRYLLQNSASPLRHALESAPWAESPSPLSMLDNSARELRFSAGIITRDQDQTASTEALILDTIRTVIQNGIQTEELLALLDGIELEIREESTAYPYGLALFLGAIGAATHGGDPAAMVDPTNALQALRDALEDPAYLTNRIETLFLNNPHRLTLTVIPDDRA